MKFRVVAAALACLSAVVPPTWALADCVFNNFAELPVTMQNLRPLVPAKINGKDARLIIDTGAFFGMLGSDTPGKYNMSLGPAPAGLEGVEGVGGAARVVRSTTTNDFVFGNIDFHRVDFLVNEQGFGDGVAGLLGENILHAADVEYDLGGGVIRLFGAKGCQDASLAYWAGSQPYSQIDAAPIETDRNRATTATTYFARLNGYRIRVLFDTGAARSILTLNAAARVGVRPGDPGVVSIGATSGVALRSYVHTWLAPFADFRIGDEEIKNFKLLIADTGTDSFDMDDAADLLIGEDFFLSHRMLVSNSQSKLYFTYSGGPVFDMRLPSRAPAADGAAVVPGGAPPTLDAEGFSRRAAAKSARSDFTGAAADLTQAIALNPTEPRYLYERGRADEHLLEDPTKPAAYPPINDFNAALTLKPDDIPALLARSLLLARQNHADLAKADLDAADKAAANDPDLRLRISEAYQAEGFGRESIVEITRWIDGHPKDDLLGAALNSRCWQRALLGQELDKALTDCNAALKLAPGNPAFLDSRGLVRLRLGDYSGSIKDYDAAIALMPSSPWSLYGRGLARLKTGRTAEGQSDLKAATALSPSMPDIAAKRGLKP